MCKNHNSVVVLRAPLKFWWMIPMGVKDNHTKFEPEIQRWWPGMGVASGGPPFKKVQFRGKHSFFSPKIALGTYSNGERKGNGVYTPHAP